MRRVGRFSWCGTSGLDAVPQPADDHVNVQVRRADPAKVAREASSKRLSGGLSRDDNALEPTQCIHGDLLDLLEVYDEVRDGQSGWKKEDTLGLALSCDCPERSSIAPRTAVLGVGSFSFHA